MVALALFGIAVAIADFDLANSKGAVERALPMTLAAEASSLRSPYLLPQLHEESTAPEGDGIRVKLRWKKVRLTVPFGPN